MLIPSNDVCERSQLKVHTRYRIGELATVSGSKAYLMFCIEISTKNRLGLWDSGASILLVPRIDLHHDNGFNFWTHNDLYSARNIH